MPSPSILLVEDNPDDEELALRALGRSRIARRIEIARDGAQALDYLFRRGDHAARDPVLPGLVLLDLKLPKIDGFQVLEQLRNDDRTRRLPVVVMTASNQQEDIVRSYDRGANSYIRKPVSFAAFFEVVAQIEAYWLALNQAPD